jgi:DHA1 family multidrug resistance protein-like MFS transporter
LIPPSVLEPAVPGSAPRDPGHAAPARWRRNQFAITAASFVGFTGFTLVMPFLPLYIGQLGVTDVGEIAMWTGLCLGVSPAVTALLSPLWGRVADRFGRKLLVERSLISFVVIMSATAYATRPWHVFALRTVQGLFAGYGGLTLAMAAESAPRDRMASAIGTVQTAQRLGPALGPVIGGVVAGLVGLRNAFFVTAGFYAAAFFVVLLLYDEPGVGANGESKANGAPTFRSVLRLKNFALLMAVLFGLQYADRSLGPVLPLHVGALGVSTGRVALVSGIFFSLVAGAAALGHSLCGRFIARMTPRRLVIAGTACAALASVGFVLVSNLVVLAACLAAFGIGVGAGMTAAYTAAGLVVPEGSHGTAFGLLTGASLTGMAVTPIVTGFLAVASIRAVFVLDVVALAALAVVVRRYMKAQSAGLRAQAPSGSRP